MRAMPALVVAVIAVAAPFAAAGKKTICTITVNSPDEREAMRADRRKLRDEAIAKRQAEQQKKQQPQEEKKEEKK